MIDHLTLTVRDYARSRAFYERVLAPLGYRVVMELEDRCAFGDEKPVFWVAAGDTPTTPMHLAFAARRRAQVDAFHAAALSEGAQDHGGPGLRAHYHASYYGAFVFDPDGHPIEAVNHREERARRGAKPGAKRAAPRRTAGKGAAARPRKAAGARRRRG